MQIGLFQIVVIALVIALLFGRGRVSATMGDVGKGVKNLRQRLADDRPRQIVAHAQGWQPERSAQADKPVG